MPSAVRLEFRGFTFAYPDHRGPGGESGAGSPPLVSQTPALDGIDFSLPAGRLAAVVGPNGAGKSTLAMAANGTIPHLLRGASRGEVLINGRPVRPPREMAREVGVVFQDFESHLVSSTVELEVAFPLENLGLPADEQKKRVMETLALVGLAGFGERVPAELSGGEKQRLAIAAAVALAPDLLVLDEPLTDLDPLGKTQVLEAVARLRDRGMTIVLVEHEPAAILAADILLVLDHGRLAWQGPPAEMLMDPGRCGKLGVPVWPPSHVARSLGVTPRSPSIEDIALCINQSLIHSPVQLATRNSKLETPNIKAGISNLVEFRNLTSGYPGGPDVLHEVSLSINAGECVALLGQNGSGKTTLAKHATGLLRPRAGAALVAGRPVREYRIGELSRIVGYVFQNPDHQIFSETVYDEVAFGVRNLSIKGDEERDRVATALAAVDLAGREKEDPFSLTKGERQKLAVASMLAYRPRAVIFDEPTTGLDASEAGRMMDFIKGLNADGMTVILITHAMWAAAEYAARVVVLSAGRIALDGPVRDVFAREDILAPLSLGPPPAVALANRLGVSALSASELAGALLKGAGR